MRKFKLRPRSSNWGGRRPGAGRPRKPVIAPVASGIWPPPDRVEAATVEAMARSCTRAALITILAIAQRGSTDEVRILAEPSKFLDVARRLGALRRPPQP